jgi:hypothetical protein
MISPGYKLREKQFKFAELTSYRRTVNKQKTQQQKQKKTIT